MHETLNIIGQIAFMAAAIIHAISMIGWMSADWRSYRWAVMFRDRDSAVFYRMRLVVGVLTILIMMLGYGWALNVLVGD